MMLDDPENSSLSIGSGIRSSRKENPLRLWNPSPYDGWERGLRVLLAWIAVDGTTVTFNRAMGSGFLRLARFRKRQYLGRRLLYLCCS